MIRHEVELALIAWFVVTGAIGVVCLYLGVWGFLHRRRRGARTRTTRVRIPLNPTRSGDQS